MPTSAAPRAKTRSCNALFAYRRSPTRHWYARCARATRLIYDAPDIVLRILTITVSLPFGYHLARRHSHRISQTMIPALVFGVLAVALRRALNQAFHQVALVPQSLAESREAFEYVAGMALAFFTGALLRRAHVLLSPAHRGKPPALIRSLAGLFRSN